MSRYAETIQYMYDALPMFHRQGRTAYKKDLRNIMALCDALGNPQNDLKCFHIAGTNGKGSVSHMLAAVLQAHGYKTGLYVSPHYKDFRERIKINGEYISRAFVCNFIEKNKNVFDQVQPSFFEMTVAMAFSWFKHKKVDYAVIETGLGGRLDSTNMVHPLMSIITNISWDHSDILGDSLEKIAVEKAGIIKQKVPVLIGRRQTETKEVFEAAGKARSAELFYADDLIRNYHFSKNDRGLIQIQADILNSKKEIAPSLVGLYQKENIKTVIAACAVIHDRLAIKLDADKIVYALEHTSQLTRIVGRWQTLSEHPLVICDSAHNEDGINYLVEQLKAMSYDQLHFICGFVKDKPLDKIFSLLPKEARYYFVKANLPRALNESELKNQAGQFGLKGNTYSSVKRGLSAAKRAAGEKDLILVAGSIFVVAEIL